MKRTATFWTTSIAALALVAIPMMATAQTYPPSSGHSTAGQSSASSQQSSGDQHSTQVHLDEAKRVLDSISTADLTGNAEAEVTTIKTQFDRLYNSYKNQSGSSSSIATGSSGTSASSGTMGTSGSTATTDSDWKTNFDSIESELDRLSIPKSSYAPPASGWSSAGTSGTSGGTGTAGSTSGTSAGSGTSSSVNLPSDVRDSLQQFRMHLEQFYSLAKTQR